MGFFSRAIWDSDIPTKAAPTTCSEIVTMSMKTKTGKPPKVSLMYDFTILVKEDALVTISHGLMGSR
jgi:hypothetical protein